MPLPLIGAVAGPAIAAAASSLGQARANRANIRLAREQMAFQERMSGTSWQRAVEDMKLAGINPMLAYQQGGASSPSGQTARVEDVIGPAVSSAMSVMRMRKELKLLDAQEYKTRQEGNVALVEGQIRGYGRVLSSPESATPVVIPWGALSREQEFKQLRERTKLTAAQRKALEYSPFLTRFTGVGAPSKFFETGIKFRDRYRR